MPIIWEEEGGGLTLNDYENITCNIVHVGLLFDHFSTGALHHE